MIKQKNEFITYLRDNKRRPIGVMYAKKEPKLANTNIGEYWGLKIGWSCLNTNSTDKWNKELGLLIAKNRAQNTAFNDVLYYDVPHHMLFPLRHFIVRASKYFKTPVLQCNVVTNYKGEFSRDFLIKRYEKEHAENSSHTNNLHKNEDKQEVDKESKECKSMNVLRELLIKGGFEVVGNLVYGYRPYQMYEDEGVYMDYEGQKRVFTYGTWNAKKESMGIRIFPLEKLRFNYTLKIVKCRCILSNIIEPCEEMWSIPIWRCRSICILSEEEYKKEQEKNKPSTDKELVIAIDVSGSMISCITSGFLSKIPIIREQFPYNIHILFFNEGIVEHRQIYRCINQQNMKKDLIYDKYGYWGTNFSSIFTKIKEKNINPITCIILTDLSGRFPKEFPQYPVIWYNYGCPKSVPFGKIIDIEEGFETLLDELKKNESIYGRIKHHPKKQAKNETPQNHPNDLSSLLKPLDELNIRLNELLNKLYLQY